MNRIDAKVIEESFDYTTYRELIDKLIAENKTTGDNHSEAMLNYTRLNISRMKRLDRTTKLSDASLQKLATIDQPMIWLVITEAWCGDAAQVVPVMEKLAAENDNIELRLILRDENPAIMDAFLTNGGRSIPKLIILDKASLDVLGSWGPRPEVLQTMVMDTKAEVQTINDPVERKAKWDAVKYETQRWYAKDKTQGIQTELLDAVLEACPECV